MKITNKINEIILYSAVLHLNASIAPIRHLADSVRSPTRLPKCNGGQVFITHTIKNHHNTIGVEYIFIVLLTTFIFYPIKRR